MAKQFGFRDVAAALGIEDVYRSFFEVSDGTYGYRRVHADLAEHGVACGPELVRALMRDLGLRPRQPQPWRHNLTVAGDTPHRIPDLMEGGPDGCREPSPGR